MSHTKGPWEVSGQLIVGPPESLPNPKAEPRGKVVASICWDYEGDHGATEPRITWKDEGRFNASLIAAAPELLEQLKLLVRWAEDQGEDPTFARAAISKATGDTPCDVA